MSEDKRVICFQGKKVNLGLLEKEMDMQRCLEWVNDPEVSKFLGRVPPVYHSSEEEWFDQYPKKKSVRVFAILLSEDGNRHIGNIGLHRIDMLHGTAVTGTLIGDKNCWQRGYGTEAKILLLHYAFTELRLEKVVSNVVEFNERSLSYAKKCGYREEGRLRKQMYRDGQRWDLVQLGILKEEFEVVWKNYKQE